MRMSQTFGQTHRKPPAGAENAGQALLIQAGYIQRQAPGILSYLPLGLRALRKIEGIIREEIDAIGGQEVRMPMVQPEALWERSGRLWQSGEELVSFSDRADRKLVLGTSHEDIAVELARGNLHSYRQLPALLYHFQTVFRDEPRASGLMRAREFDLFASYSFDRDEAGLARCYQAHRNAFDRVFRRLELNAVVPARAGATVDEDSEQEFFFLTAAGDGAVVICEECGYAANLMIAAFRKPTPASEAQSPLKKVATPGADTISALAAFLDVATDRTAKVVFFTALLPGEKDPSGSTREVVVMALVRGDMEVSAAKLGNFIHAHTLRPAEDAVIRRIGAEPGYASPIGLAHQDLLVVVDDLVAGTPNHISGANEPGYHYRNVNFGRDYDADVIADIAAAPPGALCSSCGAELQMAAGSELGSLHKLGIAAAQRTELQYQDDDGSLRPMALGSYGIGLGRLLSCVAEAHHDEAGLCLPVSAAPYQAHLVAITGGDEDIARQADALYDSLNVAGIEVLYDDREASPGVKFNDADLIGIPLRVTLGKRSLESGGAELKRRDNEERSIVPLGELSQTLATEMKGTRPS